MPPLIYCDILVRLFSRRVLLFVSLHHRLRSLRGWFDFQVVVGLSPSWSVISCALNLLPLPARASHNPTTRRRELAKTPKQTFHTRQVTALWESYHEHSSIAATICLRSLQEGQGEMPALTADWCEVLTMYDVRRRVLSWEAEEGWETETVRACLCSQSAQVDREFFWYESQRGGQGIPSAAHVTSRHGFY